MAEGDLSAPLLPQKRSGSEDSNHNPHVTITIGNDLGYQGQSQSSNGAPQFNHGSEVDSAEDNNPFEFLGLDGFSVPSTSTIDPFRNHTLKIEGVYEWVKIVICLPIALVRLALFGSALVIGYLATKLALLGWKDKHNPMPRWRRWLMWITRICARCILFSFGYHWIKRKGRPAPREVAPIVVSNHVSYVDPIFFFYELFPTIVSSESHDSMLFVGTIIRAMQVIYVNRFSPSSRKNAVSEIKRKASCHQFPRVLLFPEGTTTNGRLIISFQLGAFIPGYPIQPVAVKYPHVHFDQSWGNISLARLMFRMFTQFHNFMEVEYLPVVYPTENQKEDVFAFAERTGHAIASALNVVQTSHSYGDTMLLMKAIDSKQENPSCYMVEMAKAYNVSSLEAIEMLDKFLLMNPDSSGQVAPHDFARVMNLGDCGLSDKIFSFLDVRKTGKISFKEFFFGSAHLLKQPLFQRASELVFSECCGSGESYISKEEFANAVRLSIPEFNDAEISGLFDAFDIDNDGVISNSDFLCFLRKNPLLIAVFTPLLLRHSWVETSKHLSISVE